MTIKEAEQLMNDAYRDFNFCDRFQLIEAVKFLAEETDDTEYIVHLGGLYLEDGRYDLAHNCYQKAAKKGNAYGFYMLAYIFMDENSGMLDYEKAYENLIIAKEAGIFFADMLLADMYKDGKFVEADYNKYCEIVESVYDKIKDINVDDRLFEDPMVDVHQKLAEIRITQGRGDDAVELLVIARAKLEKILYRVPVDVYLDDIKNVVTRLHELGAGDIADLNIFDLYYLFKKPCKVRFRYEGCDYVAESVMEGAETTVRFEDKWYNSVDDFFENAVLDGEKLAALYNDIYAVEVLE